MQLRFYVSCDALFCRTMSEQNWKMSLFAEICHLTWPKEDKYWLWPKMLCAVARFRGDESTGVFREALSQPGADRQEGCTNPHPPLGKVEKHRTLAVVERA